MPTRVKRLLSGIGAFGLGLLLTFPALGHKMPPPNLTVGDALADSVFCQGDTGIIVLESWMRTWESHGDEGLQEFYNNALQASKDCRVFPRALGVVFDGCVILGHVKENHFCIYRLAPNEDAKNDPEFQPYYGILWERGGQEHGRLI